MNNWVVSDKNIPTIKTIDFLGNKFLTGNGHIGYRGTLSEYNKHQKTASIINGLYDQVKGKWREPVNAPNTLFCQLNWKGSDISVLETKILNHNQSLDLKKAMHLRSTDFLLDDDTILKVETKRFVSIKEPNLFCMEYTFISDKHISINCKIGVLGDVWDINGPHLKDFRFHNDKDLIGLACKTQEKGVEVAASTIIEFPQVELLDLQNLECDKDIYKTFTVDMEKNVKYKISLFGAVSNINENKKPKDYTIDLLHKAKKTGFDNLAAEHIEFWGKLWDDFDIKIEGDDRSQLALRFSLYHLLSLAPYHDENLSIAARGLSGQVYKGGIFWDTEMFMLPVFSMIRPELAKPLLQYRIDTLEGALNKAKEYGYNGAFYPWESQEGGYDACTHYNVNNVLTGRPMRTFFRDKQIHISADVAVSIMEYVELTEDFTLLINGGAKVILECCRFFLSWSYYKSDKERYEILDVTGPDEYHEQVNNNFYTNLMIKKSLESLFGCLEILESKFPLYFSEFILTEDKNGDFIKLKEFKDKLFIPDVINNLDIIPQFDNYLSLQDIKLEKLLEQKLHANEYLGGGEGLARWSTIIKQADVVLALSLFSPEYSKEIKKNNFKYYEPRTEHGSSLSACAYAILAGELGFTKKAYEYFIKTAEIDMKEGSKQYVGDLYIGGTHPAANGGSWLTLTRGFLGLRYYNKALIVAPNLPDSWESVSCSIKIKGQVVKIRATRDHIFLSTKAIKKSLNIVINGDSFKLSNTEEIEIAYNMEKSKC